MGCHSSYRARARARARLGICSPDERAQHRDYAEVVDIRSVLVEVVQRCFALLVSGTGTGTGTENTEYGAEELGPSKHTVIEHCPVSRHHEIN